MELCEFLDTWSHTDLLLVDTLVEKNKEDEKFSASKATSHY